MSDDRDEPVSPADAEEAGTPTDSLDSGDRLDRADSSDPAGPVEPEELGPEWVLVCALDEVPVGELKAIQTETERIVVANVEGDLYALEDQCSHQDLPLSAGELEGTSLECVFHGAKFDVCTGRATQLPAVRPVKTFDARVEDGAVYLRLG